MLAKILKAIADWSYLSPITLNRFRKQHPDETIYVYGATKAHRTDSEKAVSGTNWAFSRRSTLILTDERLKCGDWDIPIAKIKYAEASYFGSAIILKVADSSGNHYQFGLQKDDAWLKQSVIPVKLNDEPIKYSKTFSVLRVIIYTGFAIWLIASFMNAFLN